MEGSKPGAGASVVDVEYRELGGYKYLVVDEVQYLTGVHGFDVRVEHASKNMTRTLAHLCANGRLHVYHGYAWDGPSGPTIDTPNWMDASLVHDILYQMMRLEKIPNDNSPKAREAMRKRADGLMYEMLIDRGMSKFRAWYSYIGVRWFGAFAAEPERKNNE